MGLFAITGTKKQLSLNRALKVIVLYTFMIISSHYKLRGIEIDELKSFWKFSPCRVSLHLIEGGREFNTAPVSIFFV